jgi:hypothetical protein
MIRFVFRFIGLWILAAGFVALVRDGTKSIAGNAVFITKLSEDWNNLHPASLASIQPAIERHAPWLWDPVMLAILAAPTWLALGIIGSILMLVGRKRKPLIGYGRD